MIVRYYSAKVEKTLFELPGRVRLKYADYLQFILDGGKAAMCEPRVKYLCDGLYEIKVRCGDGSLRVFYCLLDSETVLVVLHHFIKKSDHTPKHELDLALKRMKEVTHD